MNCMDDTHVAQVRRGLLELAVLGLLAKADRYGSQLVDDLAAHPALAVPAGTIYPLLARLRKEGLVSSTWQESPVGPPRKYYHLTAAGRVATDDLATAWRAVRDTIDAILKEKP